MSQSVAYGTGSGATANVKVNGHGNIISALISSAVFPNPGDGLPNYGTPGYYGTLPGVFLTDENNVTLTSDYVPFETGGVWNFSAVGADDSGNVAIARGDILYMTSAGVINKAVSGVRFGVALMPVTSGSTTVIPILVGSSTTARVVRVHTNAQNGKVGATAGWVVTGGTDKGHATLPAAQTGSTLVVPIQGLLTGDILTGFLVEGQIESGGNTATLDADLRKQTTAAADNVDASLGAITQVSVTADTAVAASKTLATPETLADNESVYCLLTGTTAAATDIDLLDIVVLVTRAS